MIKAHAVPVPSDSVLAPLYVGADLLDAFADLGARCGDGDGRRQIVSRDRCCRGGAGAGDRLLSAAVEECGGVGGGRGRPASRLPSAILLRTGSTAGGRELVV